MPASYESQVYGSLQACVGACGSDGCTDLAGEDFGACAAVLGYGVINGSCVAISGCSLPTAFEGDVYQTMDACSAACD